MMGILDEILGALRSGDVAALGAATTRNFRGPIQTIIPWASNAYTETLIARAEEAFGADFWGFWMLGGMSGGGMGFIFAPERKTEAQERMQEIMSDDKARARPRAAVRHGARGLRLRAQRARHLRRAAPGAARRSCPPGYYALTRAHSHPPGPPHAARTPARPSSTSTAPRAATAPSSAAWCRRSSTRCCPRTRGEVDGELTLAELLKEHGFDRAQHEQIRADLRDGRIGLAQNRLPVSAEIEDVPAEDVATSVELSEDDASTRPASRPWDGARWPSSRSPPAPAAAGRRGPAS